jgi:curved DNA-binding protein CbpA
MSKSNIDIRKTHYEVLGLPTNSTNEDIKRSYRALQLRYHPDKTGSLPQSEQRAGEAISKAANEAYEVLLDEKARQAYDENLDSSNSPQDASAYWHTPAPEHERPTNERAPQPDPMYSNTLSVYRYGWDVSIEISQRFECQYWGPNYIWTDPESILFYVKVEERNDYDGTCQNDVHVTTFGTPGQRRVTKIESYFKHRTTEIGPDIQLWVKLFAQESAPQNTGTWDWAWDVCTKRCNPPANITNYATAIFFEHADFKPYGSAWVYQQPKERLLRDRDFEPKEQIVLVDLGNESIRADENDGRDRMKRTATFGYFSKRSNRRSGFSKARRWNYQPDFGSPVRGSADHSRKPTWGGKKTTSRPRPAFGGRPSSEAKTTREQDHTSPY